MSYELKTSSWLDRTKFWLDITKRRGELYVCEGLNPGVISYWSSTSVWMNVILNRAFVVDSDWCSSHLQSQRLWLWRWLPHRLSKCWLLSRQQASDKLRFLHRSYMRAKQNGGLLLREKQARQLSTCLSKPLTAQRCSHRLIEPSNHGTFERKISNRSRIWSAAGWCSAARRL